LPYLHDLRTQLGRSFESLYMQRPGAADGAIWSASDLSHTYDEIPMLERLVPAPNRIPWLPGTMTVQQYPPVCLVAVDASLSTGVSADPSAIAVIAYNYENFYVRDVIYGRHSLDALIALLQSTVLKYGPKAVVVEKAAGGHAILQRLPVIHNVPLYPIIPRSSKSARFESVQPLFAAGKVKFPKSAPWLEYVRNEFLRAPYGSHDDTVDAVVYALLSLTENLKLHYVDPNRRIPSIGKLSELKSYIA